MNLLFNIPSKRACFTLIEILICMGILSVCLSLFSFPLKGIRQKSKEVQFSNFCTSLDTFINSEKEEPASFGFELEGGKLTLFIQPNDKIIAKFIPKLFILEGIESVEWNQKSSNKEIINLPSFQNLIIRRVNNSDITLKLDGKQRNSKTAEIGSKAPPYDKIIHT